jgi:HEAT repeat protein
MLCTVKEMNHKKQIIHDFNSALAHLRSAEALSPTALGALSGAAKRDLAAFAQTWSQVSAERRRRAAQMLVELAEDNFQLDFNLLFRHLLNDEDAAVRAAAIDGLWEDEDSALVKAFVGFLRSDPDARVRASAADALGRFVLLAEYDRLPQTPYADLAHDALLATIRSGIEDSEVIRRSVEALAYSSRPIVRDVIEAAYADDDAAMRVSAVSAMGHTADSFWRKTVAQELGSLDPRMRFHAARAAGELEDRMAVPRLIEMLDDPDREVQSAAVLALGQIGTKQAQAALTDLAETDDDVLSNLAKEALSELDFMADSDFLLFDMDADDDSDLEEEGVEEEEED